MRKLKYLILTIMLSMALAACGQTGEEGKPAAQEQKPKETEEKKETDSEAAEEKEANKRDETGKTSEAKPQKLTFVLDWVPNTNHTGLFVAKDKGYFAEEGLEVDIVQPAEDSASVIVGMGRAEFGIHFQPNMVKRLLKKTPITAVAAILQHNTGGIMSLKSSGISTPKELAGKKYSTWEDPIDDATVQFITEKDGGDWSKVELVPGESTDATTALQLKMFDAIFVYQGWDYIHAQTKQVDTNFFRLTDYAPEFDYYTPVLIANDDFLAKQPEVAKRALRAIKKGYEFAVDNPAEAAEILIRNAPEGDADLIRASQKYLSTQYIADAESWGMIDRERWNRFYDWLYERKLIAEPLTDKGFSNEYLPTVQAGGH